jgi:hypothetical protein
MSLHSIGLNQSYLLPAQTDAVPSSFMSNKNAKPIPSSLQTVNIPSLSGSQTAGGSSIIQLPLGNSAGYIANPYIRFTVTFANAAAVATSTFRFKGAAGAATACINSYQTYVNSVQVDNIMNADQVYDTLFSHSSSNDWLTRDGSVLMGSTTSIATGAATGASAFSGTYCVPCLGLFGSTQLYPAYLCNGVLAIQINWNPVARMYGYTTADPAFTSATFSNVQFVYDRISPEQAFVDSVRNSMMQGQKFVYSYSNFQNTAFVSANGTQTFNFGLNVSSLRGLISNLVTTGDLTDTAQRGLSKPNGLANFLVTLDGRNINSNVLNYTYTVGAAAAAITINQAVVFAEMQRSIARIFDAGISDLSAQGTYDTESFAVGVSAQRVNEGNMAFSGSPVSICSVQAQNTAATATYFLTFMSDYQLLIDASGSIELVR